MPVEEGPRLRAVRMVFETIAETGERHGVIGRVARQLGIGDSDPRLITAVPTPVVSGVMA